MSRAKKDTPPRFPEFRDAFLELMGDMTLDQFSKKLEMSRATVGFYAAGQRIPDALGLKKIAEKCSVSADWLLGLTDLQTNDADLRNVCEYTGLSEKALKMILTYKEVTKRPTNRTIKRLKWIFNKTLESSCFFHLLRSLSCYIDAYSIVNKNISGENFYYGNLHEVDGLGFFDADILSLRANKAEEYLDELLNEIVEESENQSDNPLVYWEK